VRTAFIIREISPDVRGLFITLMMEAVRSSKSSVYFKKSTRRCISESCHLEARCDLVAQLQIVAAICRPIFFEDLACCHRLHRHSSPSILLSGNSVAPKSQILVGLFVIDYC
jgi:hypothetical protein